GTASTMTAIAEALGLTLPGASSILAADANHQRMCAESGRRIVDMVWEDLTPDQILTSQAVENAGVVAMAIGCSTNAVIHLLAMARRAGVPFSLQALDDIGRKTPVIANVRPVGHTYLMEDFFYAGGMRALMNQIKERLHTQALTVSGRTLGEDIDGAKVFNADVIRSLDNPVYHEGSLAVLKGNLAPDGAVIKPAACDPKFYQHTGPALVADDYDSLTAIIENENLEIDPNTVLVLRNAGPQGGPGMPEWGMIPMPKALLKKGIRDMVRLSDSRMSGTSYGACVLHVAPESFVGGPLALLKTGDLVEMSIPKRSLNMLVSDDELAARQKAWVPPAPRFERGYGWMFTKHIEQADKGCDFDFLKTELGPSPGAPDIH
ncbi:MAG: dihydroxy-acid dehydratase, partial [Burkholderiaceae bacterium]